MSLGHQRLSKRKEHFLGNGRVASAEVSRATAGDIRMLRQSCDHSLTRDWRMGELCFDSLTVRNET